VGRNLKQVAGQLRLYLPGWKSYFHLAQTPKTFKDLDSWIRHRLRADQLKHWKCGRTVYREVLKMDASQELAVQAARRVQGRWHHSQSALNEILTVSYFDRLGVPRLF
jgi:RNA-directed DNA polymerase